MKPYGFPKLGTHCKVCDRRNGGRARRTLDDKRRARATVRGEIQEHLEGDLAPEEVALIKRWAEHGCHECDACVAEYESAIGP